MVVHNSFSQVLRKSFILDFELRHYNCYYCTMIEFNELLFFADFRGLMHSTYTCCTYSVGGHFHRMWGLLNVLDGNAYLTCKSPPADTNNSRRDKPLAASALLPSLLAIAPPKSLGVFDTSQSWYWSNRKLFIDIWH